MAEREFDVVVFGASSVTGRRVAAYLESRAAAVGASWAAAARNPDRLADTLAEEGAQARAVIRADVEDGGSLAEMASRTRMVLNLVGPYTVHGRPVIQACVENGSHYVDLTGEIPFVRRITHEFDRAAQAAGVKVVQVCGFAALQAGAGAVAAAGPTVRRRASSVLRRVLPSSGFDPRADRLAQWRWRMTAAATTAAGNRIEVRADGDCHPGYLATARMLGEAGLLLASPSTTPDRSGCLTPAVAIGTDSIARFDAAGLRFKVAPPG